ncbi:MAG: GYF domain-containing protein [Muribaculaceae bacterium]|nr:GYF domain-containing protein [Muribaculaceae bacterium]
MGFFDKMKKMADMAGEFLKDEGSENIENRETLRGTVLETPPPPPVPGASESMSVRIAVNGKDYGPYERATLLEMIGNGTLTRDTYVFMDGMSGWKRACEVEKVAALFGSGAPLPPVPPAPWANSQPNDKPDSDSDNTFSPRLNKLITAAVADGEISDLERQVLIRNAQEEGVAMDEFVMVLEARLYEQRRKLTQQEEEKKHRAEALRVQQQAAMQAQQRPAPVRAENKTLTKCPHCGAPIKALATACPECGYDYNASSSEKLTAWERLSRQIAEVQNKPKSVVSGIMDIYMCNEDKQIAQLIKGCSIPTTKDELFEFFSSCAPLAKKGPGIYFGNVERNSFTLKAYYSKAQQILIKARIVMKDDPTLLSQMEEIAKKYKIKA